MGEHRWCLSPNSEVLNLALHNSGARLQLRRNQVEAILGIDLYQLAVLTQHFDGALQLQDLAGLHVLKVYLPALTLSK